MKPPPKGAVQRLEKMLAELRRREAVRAGAGWGPPSKGSMRASDILDAKALARALEYLKATQG